MRHKREELIVIDKLIDLAVGASDLPVGAPPLSFAFRVGVVGTLIQEVQVFAVELIEERNEDSHRVLIIDLA